MEHRHHPPRNALKKEIVLTLVLKFIFLYGLWFFFFQESETNKPTEQTIEQALFGSSTSSNQHSKSPSIPNQGAEAW